MQYIVVGFLFTLINFRWPIESASEVTYIVDILPDFIGYLLIWFGLEKRVGNNKIFRFSLNCAGVLLAVTFINFICQIRFLFLPLLDNKELIFVKRVVETAGSFLAAYDGILYSLSFIFALLFLFAMAREFQSAGHKIYSTVLLVLAGLCGLVAVLHIIGQWVAFPFSLAFVAVPSGIVTAAAAYFMLGKIERFR